MIASFSSIGQKKTIAQKVDSVLKLMTLDEKVGQMNQYNGDFDATGPITPDGDKQNQIRKGMLGSMLNVTGVEHTRQLQEIAMQSTIKNSFVIWAGYHSWIPDYISCSAGRSRKLGYGGDSNYRHALLQPKQLQVAFTGRLRPWWILRVIHAGAGLWKEPVKILISVL